MTQEEKYKEALLEARAVLEPCLKYSKGKVREALDSIDKELKSFESEDERIRKLLIWQVHRNIEDETNDLAQSVYDGIKGHDPDLEESIEDWKKCLAYLEKQKEQKNTSASTMAPSCWEVEQKEQKPVEPSDDELQRYQDELYDFKVFATKQAKEHHISFVHDFEWNNFCAGLLSYFNEQKPAEWSEDTIRKAVKEVGLTQHQIDWFKNNVFPPKPEWSEEDENNIGWIVAFLQGEEGSGEVIELMRESLISWLRSLRPQYHGDVTMTEAYKMGLEAGKASSWKPSEEQMEALNKARRFIPYNCDILESLYNQLKKL